MVSSTFWKFSLSIAMRTYNKASSTSPSGSRCLEFRKRLLHLKLVSDNYLRLRWVYLALSMYVRYRACCSARLPGFCDWPLRRRGLVEVERKESSGGDTKTLIYVHAKKRVICNHCLAGDQILLACR